MARKNASHFLCPMFYLTNTKKGEYNMGWTSYNATHYSKNGSIDRKAECDSYFTHGLNRGFYEIVKSSMNGSVYYAAIKKTKRFVLGANGKRLVDKHGCELIEDIPKNEQEVFGEVILTSRKPVFL